MTPSKRNYFFYEQESYEQLADIEKQKIINKLEQIYNDEQYIFSTLILLDMFKYVFAFTYLYFLCFLIG